MSHGLSSSTFWTLIIFFPQSVSPVFSTQEPCHGIHLYWFLSSPVCDQSSILLNLNANYCCFSVGPNQLSLGFMRQCPICLKSFDDTSTVWWDRLSMIQMLLTFLQSSPASAFPLSYPWISLNYLVFLLDTLLFLSFMPELLWSPVWMHFTSFFCPAMSCYFQLSLHEYL